MDDNKLVQFTSITGADTPTATQYLQLAEGNLEGAIEIYYANDGAPLEQSSRPAQAPPVPAASTRPSGHPQPHDPQGNDVIDLDSDDEYQPPSDDEAHITRSSQRRGLGSVRTEGALHTPPVATPPAGQGMDDDEAMARRLQEEFYGGGGGGGGGASAGNIPPEFLDEHGYRAPLQRTTETLVGPGSFDPNNAEEMRAAVMEQMMARRQSRPPRGRAFSHRWSSVAR